MSTSHKNGAVVSPKSNDTKEVKPTLQNLKQVLDAKKAEAKEKEEIAHQVTAAQQEQQSPQVQTQPIAEAPKAPTLEEQREKVRKLTLLFDKEQKLRDTKRNLESFKISRDETTSLLNLSDGKNASFKTHSPTLIKQVIALVLSECEAMLTDTANEIVALG